LKINKEVTGAKLTGQNGAAAGDSKISTKSKLLTSHFNEWASLRRSVHAEAVLDNANHTRTHAADRKTAYTPKLLKL